MPKNPLKQSDLAQFTGTEGYYFNPMFRRIRYTDGIKFLNEKAGWVVTDTLSHIVANAKLAPAIHEGFMAAKLVVVGGKATLYLEDGDCKILDKQDYEVTDLEDMNITMFYESGVLLLSSEH